MRRGRWGWFSLLLWLGASPPVWAIDPGLGACTKTFDTEANGYLQLSTEAAKLCSLDCLASAASGWAAAWDTPATSGGSVDTTHRQAKVVAETGAASAGDSAGTGDTARFTEFGLLIETRNCLATGSYRD